MTSNSTESMEACRRLIFLVKPKLAKKLTERMSETDDFEKFNSSLDLPISTRQSVTTVSSFDELDLYSLLVVYCCSIEIVKNSDNPNQRPTPVGRAVLGQMSMLYWSSIIGFDTCDSLHQHRLTTVNRMVSALNINDDPTKDQLLTPNELFDETEKNSLFRAELMSVFKEQEEDCGEIPVYVKELLQSKESCPASTINLDSVSALSASAKRCMRSVLQCGICEQVVDSPRTLPCLHSFCVQCLRDNYQAKDSVLICSTCERRISAPTLDAITAMPVTHVLTVMLALLKTLGNPNLSGSCAHCVHEGSAVHLYTGSVLCNQHSHSAYHSNPLDVCAAAELTDTTRLTQRMQRYCPQHAWALTLFCLFCQVPICNAPACLQWHQQHGKLASVPQVINDEIEHLKELDELLMSKLGKVKLLTREADSSQIRVADLQENIRESINTYVENIKTQLDTHKQKMMSDLDKAAQQLWNSDEQMRNCLQEFTDKTMSVQLSLDRTLQVTGTSAEDRSLMPVTALWPMKRQLLEQLADAAGGHLVQRRTTINYPENRMREMLNSVRLMQNGITPVNGGLAWDPVVKANVSKITRYFTVHQNKLYVIRRNLFVLGMSEISMYDTNKLDEEPKTISDTTYLNSEALVVTADNELWIELGLSGSIHFQSLSQIGLKRALCVSGLQLTKGKEMKRRFCVEAIRHYTKLIMKPGPDKTVYIADKSCIVQVKLDGSMHRRFDFPPNVSISDFVPDVWRDLLLITDGLTHQLIIFNCTNQQMKLIGGLGSTTATFNNPAGIALDKWGHVFVADAGNNRLQLLDLDGHFLRSLSYPSQLVEAIHDQKVPAEPRVVMHILDQYLFLWDSRTELIWRAKYI